MYYPSHRVEHELWEASRRDAFVECLHSVDCRRLGVHEVIASLLQRRPASEGTHVVVNIGDGSLLSSVAEKTKGNVVGVERNIFTADLALRLLENTAKDTPVVAYTHSELIFADGGKLYIPVQHRKLKRIFPLSEQITRRILKMQQHRCKPSIAVVCDEVRGEIVQNILRENRIQSITYSSAEISTYRLIEYPQYADVAQSDSEEYVEQRITQYCDWVADETFRLATETVSSGGSLIMTGKVVLQKGETARELIQKLQELHLYETKLLKYWEPGAEEVMLDSREGIDTGSRNGVLVMQLVRNNNAFQVPTPECTLSAQNASSAPSAVASKPKPRTRRHQPSSKRKK